MATCYVTKKRMQNTSCLVIWESCLKVCVCLCVNKKNRLINNEPLELKQWWHRLSLEAGAYSYFVNEMEIGTIRMRITLKWARFRSELRAEWAPFSYRAFEIFSRHSMECCQFNWYEWCIKYEYKLRVFLCHGAFGCLKILFRKKIQIQPICFFWIMKITPIRRYIIVLLINFWASMVVSFPFLFIYIYIYFVWTFCLSVSMMI